MGRVGLQMGRVGMERRENEGGRGGIVREGVDDEVKVGMGDWINSNVLCVIKNVFGHPVHQFLLGRCHWLSGRKKSKCRTLEAVKICNKKCLMNVCAN